MGAATFHVELEPHTILTHLNIFPGEAEQQRSAIENALQVFLKDHS